MPIAIRRPTEAELLDGFRVLTTALQVEPAPPADLESRRPSWFPERALVAVEHGQVVGNAGVFPFRTVVPGGTRLPTAGLTRVGVLPTHRRRGVLTQMMRRHLVDARERGEPLASLRASEAAIYGRFGYGLAGLAADFEIRAHRGAFAARKADGGRLRVLRPEELHDIVPRAYARSLRRPGMLERDSWMWDRTLAEHLVVDRPTARWMAVHEDDRGRPDGYVSWRTVDGPDGDWFQGGGHHIEVTELFAGSDATEAALWGFVFDLDLVERIKAPGRPLDELLRWLVADIRAVETRAVWDEQWVRLVDVGAALGGRSYHGEASVVIEVADDPVLEHNLGRYAVSGAGAERVRRRADIRLDVATLGATYLGGPSFAELAAAGRVEEVRRGAIARADSLFASRPLPWSATFF
jgi:predicted acetyltransferase